MTVGQQFRERVSAGGDREAFRHPVGDSWESVTWRQAGDRVTRLAAGLVALGIEPEQRVAIASATRYEWILADLATLCAGAATTTVYPTTVPEDVAYILADAGCRIAFAEDEDQVDKLRKQRDELPLLEHVVTFDGAPDGEWVLTLADLERRGEELLAREPDVVDRRIAGTRADSLATLIYTSGTTGRPKGVRLAHSSWTYEGWAVDALDILSEDDLQYLWLPLAHSFGKVLLSAQLAIGFATAVDGRVERIVDNLAVVRPTFMGAAPRIFEKVHGRVLTMAEREGGVKKRIFDAAFATGRRVEALRAAGRPVPRSLRARHAVLDRLVFAKIRNRFGGRIRFFVSGAAALNREVAEWFNTAGILILEGYGLTESSAGSAINLPGRTKFGTVGMPLPGTEARIAEDGEILLRGPGIMQGYHQLPDASGETVTDGWLHTGDIGELDGEHLRVTDRKKDLFKTSGGKYVAPAALEAQFKAVCPYASQVLVHGSQRHYCVALITLDPEAMEAWAEHHGHTGLAYADVVRLPEVEQMVGQYVEQVNERLNRWETIKRWTVLEHDLSVETGELTPSMKVKRRVVEERYAPQIEALYS